MPSNARPQTWREWFGGIFLFLQLVAYLLGYANAWRLVLAVPVAWCKDLFAARARIGASLLRTLGGVVEFVGCILVAVLIGSGYIALHAFALFWQIIFATCRLLVACVCFIRAIPRATGSLCFRLIKRAGRGRSFSSPPLLLAPTFTETPLAVTPQLRTSPRLAPAIELHSDGDDANDDGLPSLGSFSSVGWFILETPEQSRHQSVEIASPDGTPDCSDDHRVTLDRGSGSVAGMTAVEFKDEPEEVREGERFGEEAEEVVGELEGEEEGDEEGEGEGERCGLMDFLGPLELPSHFDGPALGWGPGVAMEGSTWDETLRREELKDAWAEILPTLKPSWRNRVKYDDGIPYIDTFKMTASERADRARDLPARPGWQAPEHEDQDVIRVTELACQHAQRERYGITIGGKEIQNRKSKGPGRLLAYLINRGFDRWAEEKRRNGSEFWF